MQDELARLIDELFGSCFASPRSRPV